MPLNIIGLREGMMRMGAAGANDPEYQMRQMRRQSEGAQTQLDAMRDQMPAQAGQAQNVGDGMNAIAQALYYRSQRGKRPINAIGPQAPGIQAPGMFPAATMKLFG